MIVSVATRYIPHAIFTIIVVMATCYPWQVFYNFCFHGNQVSMVNIFTYCYYGNQVLIMLMETIYIVVTATRYPWYTFHTTFVVMATRYSRQLLMQWLFSWQRGIHGNYIYAIIVVIATRYSGNMATIFFNSSIWNE